MCLTAIMAALAGAGGAAGAAGAAGATAAAGAATGAAATAGGLLQGLGLALSVGGTLYQGVQSAKAAREQAAALQQQQKTEAQLTAVEDQRTRERMRGLMRQQSAELIARGIDLSSPTAVLLGETAAREMSFASQEVRSRGQARQIELSSAEKIASARASSSLLAGTLGAADKFLTSAPDIWPELAGTKKPKPEAGALA